MQEDWAVILLVVIVMSMIGYVFLNLPVYEWHV